MRKKRDPWAEGSIAEINELFLRKIVRNHCPEGTHPREFLEFVMGVDYRFITRFKAKRDFRMPGLYKVTALQPIQGIGFKDIKADTVIWVRWDERVKDQIDLELQGGQGGKIHEYLLNDREWNSIQQHIEWIDKKPNVKQG